MRQERGEEARPRATFVWEQSQQGPVLESVQ